MQRVRLGARGPVVPRLLFGTLTMGPLQRNLPVEQGAALICHAAARRLLVEDWCEGCGRCVQRCGQKALSLRDGRAVVEDARCVRCGYCAAVCPQFCLKVV